MPFTFTCNRNVRSHRAGGAINDAVFCRQAGDGLGLVGSVAHNLQSACASGISSVKKVPAVAWDAAEGLILFTPRRLSRAMETVDALGGTLISAPKHLLGSLYSLVPVSASQHPGDTQGSGPTHLQQDPFWSPPCVKARQRFMLGPHPLPSSARSLPACSPPGLFCSHPLPALRASMGTNHPS